MRAVDEQQEHLIRVVLADDSVVFLNTLKRFLGQHPEFTIVGEAHNGNEALALAQQLCPDLMLLDLEMPERSGLDIIAPLHRLLPEIRIVVLSLFDWQEVTSNLGIHGYVPKTQLIDELLPAIARAMYEKCDVTATNTPEDNHR